MLRDCSWVSQVWLQTWCWQSAVLTQIPLEGEGARHPSPFPWQRVQLSLSSFQEAYPPLLKSTRPWSH